MRTSRRAAALAILAEVTRRTNRKLLGIVDIMAGPGRGALLVRDEANLRATGGGEGSSPEAVARWTWEEIGRRKGK